MGSGSLQSIYWTHRSRNYNLMCPLENHFTLFNSGHWTLWDQTLNCVLESSEFSECPRCCRNMFSEAVTPEWESCIVGCVFVGTCLAKALPSYSRCLAIDVYSDSNIPAFRQHVTILNRILIKHNGAGLNWIHLAQGRNQWQALINTVTKLRVP
jgi:hypothetical protein